MNNNERPDFEHLLQVSQWNKQRAIDATARDYNKRLYEIQEQYDSDYAQIELERNEWERTHNARGHDAEETR